LTDLIALINYSTFKLLKLEIKLNISRIWFFCQSQFAYV